MEETIVNYELVQKVTGDIFTVELVSGDATSDIIVKKNVDGVEELFKHPKYDNEGFFIRTVPDKMSVDGSTMIETHGGAKIDPVPVVEDPAVVPEESQ